MATIRDIEEAGDYFRVVAHLHPGPWQWALLTSTNLSDWTLTGEPQDGGYSNSTVDWLVPRSERPLFFQAVQTPLAP